MKDYTYLIGSPVVAKKDYIVYNQKLLTKGQSYIVTNIIMRYTKVSRLPVIEIKNNNGVVDTYLLSLFDSIIDLRNEKIDEINN